MDLALPFDPAVIRAARRRYAKHAPEGTWEALGWEAKVDLCKHVMYYDKGTDQVQAVRCPYCGAVAEAVWGKSIFRNVPALWQRPFYRCAPCDAHVGCHAGTWVPLGTLANAALREWRRAAHQAFDPLWRDRHMTRREAYAWLQAQLDLTQEACHIGRFTERQCRSAISACRIWRLCREDV